MVRTFDAISHRARQMRPAFLAIYKRFREIERQQFDNQGAGPHGPWAPLKPQTIERKRRQGGEVRTLHATKSLRKSLTTKGATGATFRVTRDGLVMGSRLRHGGPHQGGTRHMVARRPIDLWPQDKTEMVGMARDFIFEGRV